ncbi:MAG: PH domain-containing protein [Leptolyngbyaceae bacterium]|nr:PH domain-containing protein [Leptolyngbyaceae bacterium]
MGQSQREVIIWEGTPSQILNLGPFILCGLTFFLVIPIFIAAWKWLQVNSHRYQVTTERIVITQGIFSRRTEEMELYRVRDVSFIQPFWMRLFSLTDLVLSTTDPSSPTLVLQALPNAKQLWDEIRINASLCRQKRGISELDFT